MKDEEVGELWAKAKLPVVRDLIVKLVEECADRYYGHGIGWEDAIQDALERYGIDPATWPKE